MVSCNKGCCFWLFFGLSVLAISGYLFYCGWWLPIEINNHRLRYNQLKTVEVYGLSTEDWFKYNMDTESITIISYSQHIPYKYKYLIGTFIDNNTFLSNLTWNGFSKIVKNTTNSELYIIQYSEKECIDFITCFQEYIDDNDLFVYTNIVNEYKAQIDSELTSKILDDTRDGFQFIIMFILCIWLILVLEYFDDNNDNDDNNEMSERLKYLFLTIFIIFCYLLWIFTLSVIPILFITPVNMKDLDYWQINSHSLTFIVGNYFAPWWISGVIIHGIWQWCLVLICPFSCCIYIILMMICCCNDKKADKFGKWLVIPLMIIALITIIITTIGFIPLFIGNMIMWNDKTFNNLNNINVYINDKYNDNKIIILQILIGLGLTIIIIPIFAFILTSITKCIETKRGELRAIHSVKKNVSKLPLVGKSKNNQKDGGYGQVAMTTNGGDPNYDIYN